MFTEIFNNNWVMLILATIILWFFWRLTIENKIETYGNGAIGPYTISTGNQAYATRPSARTVKFRYLDDYRNW